MAVPHLLDLCQWHMNWPLSISECGKGVWQGGVVTERFVADLGPGREEVVLGTPLAVLGTLGGGGIPGQLWEGERQRETEREAYYAHGLLDTLVTEPKYVCSRFELCTIMYVYTSFTQSQCSKLE